MRPVTPSRHGLGRAVVVLASWLSRQLETTIPSLLMLGMVVLTAVSALGRYLLGYSILSAAQAATFMFVWLVFLAAASGVRRGVHVGIDVVVNFLPRSVRNVLGVVVDLAILCVAVGMTYLGFEFARESTFRYLQTLGIPYAYLYLAIPVGGSLIVIHVLIRLARSARSGFWDAPETLSRPDTGLTEPGVMDAWARTETREELDRRQGLSRGET